MQRFSKDEEEALCVLLEKGNAVVIFSAAELGPADRQRFMEVLFAHGFGIVDAINSGRLCPDCLGNCEKKIEAGDMN
jgi:hypothetical protein